MWQVQHEKVSRRRAISGGVPSGSMPHCFGGGKSRPTKLARFSQNQLARFNQSGLGQRLAGGIALSLAENQGFLTSFCALVLDQ
jgi:hypothetical protein